MRKKLTCLMMWSLVVAATVAHAAPRQVVVIVAEGLSPQIVELGSSYVKYPPEENNAAAFDDLMAKAKAMPAGAVTVDSLKGVLKTAAANGWKTGLVTTGDVTKVAPLFYDLPTDNGADVAGALVNNTAFDFIGGGGRGHFVPQGMAGSMRQDATDLGAALTKAGGTAVFDADKLQAADLQVKGRTLALQSDDTLAYALDRDAANEGGLGDLAALALEHLAAGNAPFMLVIHDALLAKAVAAHDTPALAGQFRELDSIVASVLGARDEHPDLALALLATGGSATAHLAAATPDARSNTLYVLSGLPMSFAKAGSTLQGATDDKLTEFATDAYTGWKLSAENRAAVLAGTMTPEAALRASYEPVLQVGYDGGEVPPMLYSVGLDITGDLAQTLTHLAGAKPDMARPAP